MPKKRERVEFGLRMKAVRERLGMDRHAFGKLLGVGYKTVQQVELGYQALGDRRKAAVYDLEAGRTPQTLQTSGLRTAEEAPGYRDDLQKDAKSIQDIMDVVLSDDFKDKAAEIARISGCDFRTAGVMLVEVQLGKRGRKLR